MSVSLPRAMRAYTQSTRRISSKISPCRTSVATSWHPLQGPAKRWETTASAPVNPKISTIVDQISQLTLLETADLVSNLKTRLNIPDMPVGNFSAGPMVGAGGAAPAAVEEEEDAAPATEEKTLFAITLKSFDTGAKPKVIKEIKNMLGLSLVDSKKFVESAPKQMKESVPKEEAEKLVELMKGIGAVVTMD